MAQIFPVGPPAQIGVPEVLETDPFVPLDMRNISSLLDRNASREQMERARQAMFLKEFNAIANSTKQGPLALSPYSKFHERVFDEVNADINSALTEAMDDIDKYGDPVAAQKKLMEVGNKLRSNKDYALALAESKGITKFLEKASVKDSGLDPAAVNPLLKELRESETPFDMARLSDPLLQSADIPTMVEDLMTEAFEPSQTVRYGLIPGTEDKEGIVQSDVQAGPEAMKASLTNLFKTDPVAAAYLERRGMGMGTPEFDRFLDEQIDAYSIGSKPGAEAIMTTNETGEEVVGGYFINKNYTGVKNTTAKELSIKAQEQAIKDGAGAAGGGSMLSANFPGETSQFTLRVGPENQAEMAEQATQIANNYQQQTQAFNNGVSISSTNPNINQDTWTTDVIDIYNAEGEGAVRNEFQILDANGNPDIRATEAFIKEDLPRLTRAKNDVDRATTRLSNIREQVMPEFTEYLKREGYTLEELQLFDDYAGLQHEPFPTGYNAPSTLGSTRMETGSAFNKQYSKKAVAQEKALAKYRELSDKAISAKYDRPGYSMPYHPVTIDRKAKDTDFGRVMANTLATQFRDDNLMFYDTNPETGGRKISKAQFSEADEAKDVIKNYGYEGWNDLEIKGIAFNEELNTWMVVANPVVRLPGNKTAGVITKGKDLVTPLPDKKGYARKHSILIPIDANKSEAFRNFVGDRELADGFYRSSLTGLKNEGTGISVPLPGRGEATLDMKNNKYIVEYANPQDNLDVITKFNTKDEAARFLMQVHDNANAYIRPKNSYEAINFLPKTDIANLSVHAQSAIAHANNYVLNDSNRGNLIISEGYRTPQDQEKLTPGQTDTPSTRGNTFVIEYGDGDTYGEGKRLAQEFEAAMLDTESDSAMLDLLKKYFGTTNVNLYAEQDLGKIIVQINR